MLRSPCVCGDDVGLHDKDSLVCAQRRCKCLRFVALFSRQGTMRHLELHRTAADCVIGRAGVRGLDSYQKLDGFGGSE